MAVVSVQQMIPRRATSLTQRKTLLTEVQVRRYVKQFLVITDNVLDGPAVIRAAYGVPRLGESYVSGNDVDVLATCVNIETQPTEHPNVFHLLATYDTSRLVDATLDNPLNAPPEITWTFAGYTRPLVRDLLGVPVVNSSKEAFDPPYEVEDSRPTVTITRNEPTYDPARSVLYQDACNSDTWSIATPYAAKVMQISGARAIDMGITYYRVTYEIQMRRETFAVPILDQGYRDIDRKLFRDPLDHAPLSNPTLLNGRGRRREVAQANLASACDANVNSLDVDFDVPDWPPLAAGGNPIAPHWYFEARIDSEVVQVTRVVGGTTWLVQRGYAGTIAAAHNEGAAITLEPYYLRFLPFKALPFRNLNLPVL